MSTSDIFRNPLEHIRSEVEEIISHDINPSLWHSSGCAISFGDIRAHGTSYRVHLVIECEDEIPPSVHAHARQLEWHLRDELTLPGLLVEIIKA